MSATVCDTMPDLLASLVASLCTVLPIACQTAPAETRQPEAKAEAKAEEAPALRRVDEFLAELEKTATTIQTLSGGLALEKYDALVEETERRFGRVVLDLKDGKRRFALYFDEVVNSDGRSTRAIDHWIYADGWLCEQDHRNKSLTKRQIVPPGKSFDPLALGEGPIPIPIGQKREEVLARFEVAEAGIPDDVPLLGSMRNVAGLRLVPKPGTEMAKNTAAVELFYDRTSLAPTGIVVREKNGNRSVARISSPVVNGEVKAEDRALLEIPQLDPKEWAIDERPWNSGSPGDAGAPSEGARKTPS
jgi:hypothetical protein